MYHGQNAIVVIMFEEKMCRTRYKMEKASLGLKLLGQNIV